MTIELRTDDDQAAPRQGADGNGHLVYFDVRTQASFVWDGESPEIEVSIGGYGEPVDHTTSSQNLPLMDTYAELLIAEFNQICLAHAATLPDYGSR